MSLKLKKVRIGFVGCGNICRAYLKISRKFPILETVAVADIDPERAKAAAKFHGSSDPCTLAQLLARDDVEIVVNLTPPAAHAELNLAAIAAGKHVYTEKPLATDLQGGRETLAAAEKAGVLVGCAPDTVLGGGYQTCRKLIDDGAIGEPVSANAFVMGHGPEAWHPDPEFFYAPGGGPLMDMGPYYLTALTMLIGPVRVVRAMAKVLVSPRVIGTGPKAGKEVPVTTPDHIVGALEFVSGAVGTLITSFAVWNSRVPRVEIHGTESSLCCPDPNRFGGPVYLYDRDQEEWQEVPLTHGYAPKNQRSLGIADMATAIRTGRPHRATGAQAYHVLEVMHAMLAAADTDGTQRIESSFTRPAPLPADLAGGELDE